MTLNKHLFLLILIIIVSPYSWALNSDKNKPVEVEADNFNLDEKKQIPTLHRKCCYYPRQHGN